MRIAIDRQIFQFQKYGGVSRYFFHLAAVLNALGETVRILDPGKLNAYLPALPERLWRTSYVEQLANSLPSRIENPCRPFLDALARKRLQKWRPSLLHETYYQKMALAPKGVPVVLTVYDMIHELFPEEFAADDPTSERKRIAVDRADHVICISESTRRDLIEIFDVPVGKVSVTLLGYDSREISPSSHLRTGIATRPYLLFVGYRRGYKNFNRLLDAYLSSPSLRDHFDLLAFGGPPFDDQERRILRDSVLREGQIRHETGDDQLLSKRYHGAPYSSTLPFTKDSDCHLWKQWPKAVQSFPATPARCQK
jgi:glycosyltransferase involved in cell wall biosynthesis